MSNVTITHNSKTGDCKILFDSEFLESCTSMRTKGLKAEVILDVNKLRAGIKTAVIDADDKEVKQKIKEILIRNFL